MSIFFIYKFNYKKGYNYIAIGDDLALGVNAYGMVEYGYFDYISSWLSKDNMLLDSYNGFSYKGCSINSLYEDIYYNRNADDKNIKRELREADVVTISVGMNDITELFHEIGNSNYSLYLNEYDDLVNDFERMLKEVKKYAKGKIIVLGYYMNDNDKDTLKNIKYINNRISNICDLENVIFVDIYDVYINNPSYFPRSKTYLPVISAYYEIALKIWDVI